MHQDRDPDVHEVALIAHTYSGKAFCAGAPDTWKLMRNWLGRAIVTDYTGRSVMRWTTYALALDVGFSAWAWADSMHNVITLKMPVELLIPVTSCITTRSLSRVQSP